MSSATDPHTEKEYLGLITKHQIDLYAFIRSLLPQSAHIEDILQETNIVLWDKIDTFQTGTNFKAFAFKIAYFKVKEYQRKTRSQNWLEFDSELLEKISRQKTEAHTQSPTQAALRNCVSKLSKSDQELLEIRYHEHKSVRQLASERGRSEGAIQQQLFRIRNVLRLCIQQFAD